MLTPPAVRGYHPPPPPPPPPPPEDPPPPLPELEPGAVDEDDIAEEREEPRLEAKDPGLKECPPPPPEYQVGR